MDVRVDAFELWCWTSLLRVPWTSRRSNQSILKEISPEYSLEGLMLKLNLQYFGHLMRRTDSLEKTLMLGRIEGRRRRGWQRMDGWMASPSQWTWIWVSSGCWWWAGKPGVLQSMGCKESDMTERLNLTEMPVWGRILLPNALTAFISHIWLYHNLCLLAYYFTPTMIRTHLNGDSIFLGSWVDYIETNSLYTIKKCLEWFHAY